MRMASAGHATPQAPQAMQSSESCSGLPRMSLLVGERRKRVLDRRVAGLGVNLPKLQHIRAPPHRSGAATVPLARKRRLVAPDVFELLLVEHMVALGGDVGHRHAVGAGVARVQRTDDQRRVAPRCCRGTCSAGPASCCTWRPWRASGSTSGCCRAWPSARPRRAVPSVAPMAYLCGVYSQSVVRMGPDGSSRAWSRSCRSNRRPPRMRTAVRPKASQVVCRGGVHLWTSGSA